MKLKIKNYIFQLSFLIIVLISCKQNENRTDSNNLKYLCEGFHNPPMESRPRALWDWVDGNFSLDEITNEMEAAKEAGMGGFDIWDVRKVVDENGIVPAGPAFMSDEYLKGIVHAANEAERLGLSLGLVVSSGWNAGGPWTKPENQTMGLFTSEKIIEGGREINVKLDFPELPDKVDYYGRIKKLIIPRDKNGKPKFYRDVKVLALPLTKDSAVIKESEIIDVSDKMDTAGVLRWNAPEGKFRVIRYVCTNTGQPMISSTPNSTGPMIDHFNPEATKEHINFFIDKIEKALGKPIGKSGLDYFYTDSYEVRGLLWTPDLSKEFKARTGYSLTPFLPVFYGFTVENEDVTSRFLYDFRKVWSDLIINSHYKNATEICKEHGIDFVAEAAGPGMPVHNCPFESLKSSGVLSYPRGEFWHIPEKNSFFRKMDEKTRHHFYEQLQVIKGVASASHIYDRKYVEAEAFTGLHLYVEGPGDLKQDADRAFCEGLNRIVFHTFPHTPKAAGIPGWSYAFGTLMNDTRVWWPMVKPWMQYLGRISFLLQQGNFVGDILYYYGDSVPNFVPPKKFDPDRGFGYDYDYTNTEVLMRLKVDKGELYLDNGQRYRLLVLPEEKYMVYPVLKKIKELVKAGAVVTGPKPEKSNGLKDRQEHDSKVRELADELWGNCDGVSVKEHKYGKGKIVWGKTVKEILKEMNVIPDLDFKGNLENRNLDFIHRRTDVADIYFIRNTTEQKITGEASFRITDKQPEFWNPVSGKMNKIRIFVSGKNKITIPVALDPEESVFVVFTEEKTGNSITKVVKDGKNIFPGNYGTVTPLFVQDDNSNVSQLLFESPGNYEFFESSGNIIEKNISMKPEVVDINGRWSVFFPSELKGVGKVFFDSLYSWHTSEIFDVKFFSGTATYEKEFTVPENADMTGTKAELDLGLVRDIAHIYINGRDVGISWVKPNVIDVSGFIHKGVNELRVDVANTWHNRLCGDARLPESGRITRTNLTRLPNAWAYPMEKIPFKEKGESYGLQESGLLGPVKITFTEKMEL
jgi:hypothetical protein